MGVYYALINNSKKEFIDGVAIGTGSKWHSQFPPRVSRALYFLLEDRWAGDSIQLINDAESMGLYHEVVFSEEDGGEWRDATRHIDPFLLEEWEGDSQEEKK